MLGAVADILRRRGSEGWLVGGSVRDRMLGRFSPDLDVVVADDAAAVAKEVATALHAPWFALSERYPTYRVLGPDGHVDVAAVRGGSILADLGQRDFTVNAMAVPVGQVVEADPERGVPAALPAERAPAGLPEPGALLDPFGGATHLRERRLVAVSEYIFADDPLRLMRAPRFCHTLGLRLDDDLARTVRAQAGDLSAAAAERVMNEMCLTLASGRAAAAVRLWADLGLLTVVLPELFQPSGAPGERWAATLALLERLDDMIERPDEWFPESAAFLVERAAEPVDGAVARPVALRLAGLTHTLSAERACAAGRRLKLSSALVSLLSAVARCVGPGGDGGEGGGADGADGDQGRPPSLAALLPPGAAVTREAVAFLWQAAPWEPEVLLVATAAGAGAGGSAGASDWAGPARRMMVLAAERARGDLVPPPVDGEVLMRELGLEGGPALGTALREARLAWEAGEAVTVDELLAVGRRALPKT